jgi:hypothetical protein
VAFTYAISTDRGKVRLLLSDTDADTYVFEDDEIDYFLDRASGDVDAAAVVGLKVLLADRARRAKRFSLQGLSLDDTGQIAALTEAIRLLGGDQPTFSVVMPAPLEMDAGFTEPTS